MRNTTFPAAINNYLAPGVPGDKASHNPCVYTLDNPLADGNVTVGGFVWLTLDGAASTGTGRPLGFVERVLTYVNTDLLSGASMIAPAGSALTVARRGDFYAVASTAATAGQKVFALLANGGLATGAAGATVAGAVETDWTVLRGGAAGELITISNWS